MFCQLPSKLSLQNVWGYPSDSAEPRAPGGESSLWNLQCNKPQPCGMPASSGDPKFYTAPFPLLIQRWPWSLQQALMLPRGEFAPAEIPSIPSPVSAVSCFSGYKDSFTHFGIKCHLPFSLFHLDSWISGKLEPSEAPAGCSAHWSLAHGNALIAHLPGAAWLSRPGGHSGWKFRFEFQHSSPRTCNLVSLNCRNFSPGLILPSEVGVKAQGLQQIPQRSCEQQREQRGSCSQ